MAANNPPGTTWFLRDRAELEALVAALSRSGSPSRQVRLWSVGCSTGQEPYGLAMALLDAGLQPLILASDISEEALATAQAARYSTAAVSVLPLAWRQRYTTQVTPQLVAINPAVKARVSFLLHDVARASIPPDGWGRFDAVVCRNVLIYIERSEAVAIIKRLVEACVSDGYLLLSAAERPLAWLTARLREDEVCKDTVLLRRLAGGGSPGPESPRPPAAPGTAAVLPVPSGAGQTCESLAEAAALVEATAQLHRGDFAQTLAIVDAVLAREPLQAVAQLLRGLSLKHTGQALAAVAALRRARFLFGDESWLAPYQLGVVLDQLGQPSEAAEAYRHALAVIRAGGRSGLAEEGQAEAALLRTVAETCQARLRALS